jgi:hypothetical protein
MTQEVREKFEQVMSMPPYEFDMARHPDDSSRFAWPGGYVIYHVQCAWDAWQEAYAAVARESLERYASGSGEA